MTAEEIEAIVGGYHGDAFRILGPHAVRKKGGQARWEVRAFLPQAESAAVVGGRRARARWRSSHPQGFFCAALDGEPRAVHASTRACGTAARSRSTTPIASARRSPIPICICTPKARCTKPGARWART